MVSLTGLKDKVMFWKELWPTDFRIYRKRGDGHAYEDVKGVRLKYDDRPDCHKLDTGERMPAIPKKYSLNKVDGTPGYHVVEADDEQLVAFKPDFDANDDAKPKQLHYITAEVEKEREKERKLRDSKSVTEKEQVTYAVETEFSGDEELDENVIQNLSIDTEMSEEELENELEKHNFDVVNFTILENKDQRLTFLGEEVKTAETKYKPSSLIRQYPQLTLTVGAAVAFAIIIYATSQEYGQFVPVLKDLSGNMGVFENLAEQAGSSNPPGN